MIETKAVFLSITVTDTDEIQSLATELKQFGFEPTFVFQIAGILVGTLPMDFPEDILNKIKAMNGVKKIRLTRETSIDMSKDTID